MKTTAIHPGRTTVKFVLIASALGALYAFTNTPPTVEGGGAIATTFAQSASALPTVAVEGVEPEDSSARDYCCGA